MKKLIVLVLMVVTLMATIAYGENVTLLEEHETEMAHCWTAYYGEEGILLEVKEYKDVFAEEVTFVWAQGTRESDGLRFTATLFKGSEKISDYFIGGHGDDIEVEWSTEYYEDGSYTIFADSLEEYQSWIKQNGLDDFEIELRYD